MFRRHDRQILFMAIVLLGATVMSSARLPGPVPQGDSPPPSPLSATLGRALVPVEHVLSTGAARVTGLMSGTRDVTQLTARVAELESENAALKTQGTKLGELARENDRLRALLDFKQGRVDLDLSAASIYVAKVAEEPGNLMATMKLDVGQQGGVERGMAVANDRGLVGQIIDATDHWSTVRLVTDPSSQVWARIQRSGATGMVMGSTTGELVMRYIAQDQPGQEPNVSVGDIVVTSGLSDRFPPMILIGQVTEVHQSDVQTHQEALVRPTVNFNALEHILVIHRWRNGPLDVPAAPTPAMPGSGQPTSSPGG